MQYPLQETVAKITVADVDYYLFPRYFGDSVVSAETIANGAVRGKEVTFQAVHNGADRRVTMRKLNIRRVDFIDSEIVAVPADIVALYKAPDNETPEQEKIRLTAIKNYFETK